MEKILSEDQKRLVNVCASLKDNAWWQTLVKEFNQRADECRNILLGNKKIVNQEDPTKSENLDEIKYSMNSILRKELKTIEDLINYPEKLINSLWYYKPEKE